MLGIIMTFRTYLIALLALCPLSLNAMISYTYLKTPDNKPILLLGDDHGIDDPKILSFLGQVTSYIRSKKLVRPIPFIVESEEPSKITLEFVAPSLLHLLKVAAGQKGLATPPFAFKYFEARGNESACIEGLTNEMSPRLVEGIPAEMMLARYTQGKTVSNNMTPKTWTRTEKQIKAHTLLQRKIPRENYAKHLAAMLLAMKKIVEKYSNSPAVKDHLEVLLEQATKATTKILEDFTHADFAIAYCKSFLGKTLEERLAHFEHFENLYAATDYTFADCSFFDVLQDTLAVEPCACMLVGNAHLKGIKTLLSASGCKIIADETLQVCNYPLYHHYGISSAFLPHLLENILPDFLKPSAIEADMCWACHKKPEKLSFCARCKTAAYCDAVCQKNDWAAHKVNCKAK